MQKMQLKYLDLSGIKTPEETQIENSTDMFGKEVPSTLHTIKISNKCKNIVDTQGTSTFNLLEMFPKYGESVKINKENMYYDIFVIADENDVTNEVIWPITAYRTDGDSVFDNNEVALNNQWLKQDEDKSLELRVVYGITAHYYVLTDSGKVLTDDNKALLDFKASNEIILE